MQARTLEINGFCWSITGCDQSIIDHTIGSNFLVWIECFPYLVHALSCRVKETGQLNTKSEGLHQI